MDARTALLALVAVTSACGAGVPRRDDVVQRIEDAAATHGDTVVLGDLTDFGWDELCVYSPDARREVISDFLGFAWRGPAEEIGQRQLVMFVERRDPNSRSQANGYFFLRGNKVLFDVGGCITRKDATFVVQQWNSGMQDVKHLVRVRETPAAPVSERDPGADTFPSSPELPKAAALKPPLLPPDSFRQVPAPIRRLFAERGCEVPQATWPRGRNNFVSGEFATEGQTDWAALCWRNGRSQIEIVWGGATQCPTPILPGQNDAWDDEGYVRYLLSADATRILSLAESFDGPQPPARDHAGVEDGYVGKFSKIMFCHDGSWIALQGMD